MTFIAAGVTAGTAAAVAAGATAGGLAAAAGGVIGGALAAGVVGAGLGAATSAITGGDVGQGALYGGIGGVVTGGVAGALGGGAAGAAGGAAGAEAGGTAGASIGSASGNAISSGIASAAPEAISASEAATQAAISPTFSSVGQGAIAAGENVAPTALQSAASNAIPAGLEAPSWFQQGLSYVGDTIKAHPVETIQGLAAAGQGINALTQTYPELGPKQGMKPRNTHLAPNYQRSAPTSYKPLASYAEGGIAQSGMFPQSMQDTNQYATPSQMPQQAQMLAGQAVNADYGQKTGVYTGEPISFAEGGTAPPMNKYYAAGLAQAHAEQQARQQMQQPLQTVAPAPGPMPAAIPQAPLQPAPTAPGGQSGIASLQGYASGRFVSGEGTGISDSIPAIIDGKQPAKIASGEYILPSRIVSEIGQGDSSAGAKRLDKMVADIQRKRSKTVGKGKIAVNSRAFKSLPV